MHHQYPGSNSFRATDVRWFPRNGRRSRVSQHGAYSGHAARQGEGRYHFGGNPAYVLDYNRACTPVASVEQLRLILDDLSAEVERNGSSIVGIRNRFAVPASSGYRDLKYYHQTDDGFISTGRVIFAPSEEELFFATMFAFWGILTTYAKAELERRGIAGPAVIIADNYHRDDQHSCFVVHGFPSTDSASSYARSRMDDILRILVPQSRNTENLRSTWIMFGEDFCILRLEPEHDSFLGGVIRSIIMELPTSKERPYWAMEEAYGLGKFSLLLDEFKAPDDQSGGK